MTSPVSQLVPVIDVRNADTFGTGAELNLELARRCQDAYEEGASSAATALFAGLLIGAGSTALMIWLATLVL